MNKLNDIIRQIVVVFSIVITLVVNGLANALPINGQNTGQISDRFHVYFVPAGYVFSIWALIYLGLIVFATFQALPSQRNNPRLRATGWFISLGGLANSAWIFLWHYEQFLLTLIAMLVLLLTLMITYKGLGIGRVSALAMEKWSAQLPFSIYLGWVTVATVANVTDVLDYFKWGGFGLAPVIWMMIVLFVVFLITGLMIFTYRDLAYALVILWALVGLSIKNAGIPLVFIPTWITFALVAMGLVFAYIFPINRRYATKSI